MADLFMYEVFEEEQELLSRMLGKELAFEMDSRTIQETGHAHPPARLISIRTQSIIPTAWAPQLDGVLSRSTGYDHLVEYAQQIEQRFPLGYLEEYASRAVAEQAILMVMALLRRLPRQIRQFPAFDRDGLTGSECKGRNLLVIGVGRIGGEIVTIAKGLGFNVRGHDIVPNKPDVDYVSKEKGMLWADVIVNSMNLTQENRHYFNDEFFRSVRQGAMFVNIARGEHSPLAVLQRALDAGTLAGVGLDVFENEGAVGVALRSRDESKPEIAATLDRLLSHPNVLFTPHNAFNSHEALRGKADLTVQQIRHFVKHRDFLWKVEY
jgi:D-lactate dehydrogenase